MKAKFLIIALVLSLSLGACSSDGKSGASKEDMGAWLGALTGGFIGSHVGKGNGQLWATGAGAALGALAGSNIGKQLDQADLAYHHQALEDSYSAPLNETIKWENEETGHSGSVTPIREGRREDTDNLCRKYEQTIYVDGEKETAVGVACQNDDGTWTIGS